MAGGGRVRGGICELLDLIEEHRGALEYDYRTRFPGITDGLDGIPAQMGWGEAARMVNILRADPSSALASAMAGWDFPISREALATLDLYDLMMAANSDPKKRVKPHSGRPFDMSSKTERKLGNAGGRTRAEVVEILNAMGHQLPV